MSFRPSYKAAVACSLTPEEVTKACLYFEGSADSFEAYNHDSTPIEVRAGLKCDIAETEAEERLRQADFLPFLIQDFTPFLPLIPAKLEQTAKQLAAQEPHLLIQKMRDCAVPEQCYPQKQDHWIHLLPEAISRLQGDQGPGRFNQLQERLDPTSEQHMLENFENRFLAAQSFSNFIAPLTEAMANVITEQHSFRRDASPLLLANAVKLAFAEKSSNFAKQNWIVGAVEHRIGYDNYKACQAHRRQMQQAKPKEKYITMSF